MPAVRQNLEVFLDLILHEIRSLRLPVDFRVLILKC